MRKYVVIEDSQNLSKGDGGDNIYNIRAIAICDSDEEAVDKAVETAKKHKVNCIKNGWTKVIMGFHGNGLYVTAFGDKRTWTCKYIISIVDG